MLRRGNTEIAGNTEASVAEEKAFCADVDFLARSVSEKREHDWLKIKFIKKKENKVHVTSGSPSERPVQNCMEETTI